MSKIQQVFAQLQQKQKKAVIPYVMAGDPNPTATVPLMHELVAHGADIIELGMPFGDPMADGKIIATAAERALAQGTNTRQAIEMVKIFRQDNQHTPVILMGYLNPIEIIGHQTFLSACQDAGVDGILIVDLPPQEAGDLLELLAEHDMDEIFLLSPTTLPERREQVLKYGRGFIYYVSLKGVTGASNLDVGDVTEQVQQIKAMTDLPVCVGFGIKDAKSAKSIGQMADGIIVGSALVKHFANIDVNDAHAVNQAKDKLLATFDDLVKAINDI